MKWDERNDWGLHRFPGYRSFREGDIILFHAKDNYKTVLVKRIAYTVHEKGEYILLCIQVIQVQVIQVQAIQVQAVQVLLLLIIPVVEQINIALFGTFCM